MLKNADKKPKVHPSANGMGNIRWTCESCHDTYGWPMGNFEAMPRLCEGCKTQTSQTELRIEALEQQVLKLSKMVITLARIIKSKT